MFDDGIIQALMNSQKATQQGQAPLGQDLNQPLPQGGSGGLGSGTDMFAGIGPRLMGMGGGSGGMGGLMGGGLMGMLGNSPPGGLMGAFGGGQSPQMNRPPQIGQSMPSGIADDPNKRPAVPTLNSQTSPF